MSRALYYTLIYIRTRGHCPASVVQVIHYDPQSGQPIELWNSLQEGICHLVKITGDESIAQRPMFWQDEQGCLVPLTDECGMQMALKSRMKNGNKEFLIFQEETRDPAEELAHVMDNFGLT